jgi:hypothetical protein
VTLPRKASAIAKLRVEKRQKRELMRKIGNYIMPHAYGKIYCAVGSTVQYVYMNINIKILLTIYIIPDFDGGRERERDRETEREREICIYIYINTYTYIMRTDVL